MNDQRIQGSSLRLPSRPGTILVILIFWLSAFAISSAASALLGHIPFELVGSRRAAAFLFSALLAYFMTRIIDRTSAQQPRERVMISLAGIIVMPVLHASFLSLTCKVAPIPGIRPMNPQEVILAALLSSGYFAAWTTLHLALVYYKEATQSRGASPPVNDEVPDRGMGMEPSKARFWASQRNLVRQVREEEILLIEAQKDYVVLHTSDGNSIMRGTLTSVGRQLSPELFVRVHRSAIVRRSSIAGVYRRPSGALTVRTSSGRDVPVGRSYAGGVRDLLRRLDDRP
jgi:hypothetical protein